MAIVKVLGRVWIPLVILLVIGRCGFIVSRVHAIFGSGKHRPHADGHVRYAKPSNPQQVRYPVFGRAGTVADAYPHCLAKGA
ncbi:MAG: MmpS family transport accessory protein [Mycobacterium sp.]